MDQEIYILLIGVRTRYRVRVSYKNKIPILPLNLEFIVRSCKVYNVFFV